MVYLIPAFFITAFLYASVGFGGGSTYNALLILYDCLLYTSPSPRDRTRSRMPSSA